MIKSELQEILNRINNLSSGSTETIAEYTTLVKMAVEKLQTLHQEDKSPMLDVWLGMGLQEIRHEIDQRLKIDFPNLSAEKLKTEFMYSKSTVTMSLTNILMHL